MKISFSIAAIALILFFSCTTVVKEAQNWIEQSNASAKVEPQGGHYYLKNGTSRIKPFLPSSFQEKTLSEYKIILDTLLTKQQLRNEMRRLEEMRDIKGDFYLFFDLTTMSTYTLNTMPYLNFNRKDAKMLLSIIKQNNNKVSLTTDLNFKKLTASFSKTADFTLFKSIYRVDNFKEDFKFFSTFYIISVKQQTFMINLTTPFEVDFDPYIEKMKF